MQFASVLAGLLDTLPGEKARQFTQRLRQGVGLEPVDPWPKDRYVFETVEFSTAQLLPIPTPETITFGTVRYQELELQIVSYKTATIKRVANLSNRVRQDNRTTQTGVLQSVYEIQRTDTTAWAFHEPLQRDGHLPGATVETADPLTLTLIEIPAGSFLMGSPPEEPERSDDEGPQHEVKLASFFMSHTPITQAQWREVAGWQPLPAERWGRDLNPDPFHFYNREGQAEGEVRLFEAEAITDNRPVEQVSWLDAMEFCNRLSQRTGRTYTLPSESQWEYSCRAETVTPFHFGDTISPELANYRGDFAYTDGPQGVNREQTTPVGMFPANGWGLHDMHGNVWEWCQDEWHDRTEGAPTDGRAWVDVAEGGKSKELAKTKLLRGGSWYDFPWICRSADRSHVRPGLARDLVGFRVVCLPQGPSLNH